jgi:hypothetical protein
MTYDLSVLSLAMGVLHLAHVGGEMYEMSERIRRPPENPASLRPRVEKFTFPKPILSIDSMEQKPYSFWNFRKWFAVIERRRLPIDYSIEGLEDQLAVERKSLEDCSAAVLLFKSW